MPHKSKPCDAAGDHADVALSLNVVTWNAAIAGGGVVGGLLLDRWGAGSFPWALLALLLGALSIAWFARNHGFPAGAVVIPARQPYIEFRYRTRPLF